MPDSFRGMGVLLLAVALPVSAAGPADERRVLLGAGGGVAFVTPAGPLASGYAPGVHASLWSSLPLGAVFGLRPAVKVFDVGRSFGAGPGARLDLELGCEFTLHFRYVDLALALVTAVTFRATSFDVRALGLGPSLGLQGLFTGRFGWLVRTTHRLTVTLEEALLLHQVEAGLLVRL